MCDERERLIGYLYDECDAEERRQVETHLDSCPTCRAEIGGLQSVRTDLLGWEVPEHAPVWRPMPAAVVPPIVWWRQSPGWALAAAATVVLAAGVAGGAATRIMTPPPQAQVTGVTPEELNAVQQQLVAMLRAELDRVRTTVAAETAATQNVPVAAAENPRHLQRVATLEENTKQTVDVLVGLNQRLIQYKLDSDRDVLRMRRQIEELQLAIDQAKGGGR